MLSTFICLVAFIVVTAYSETTRWSGLKACPKPATIAIFGGTGCLGRECVYQALKDNHKVIVLAKDPAKMLIPEGSGGSLANTLLTDKRLTIIKGDVTEQAAVDAVFAAANDISGVVVALGGRTANVGLTMLTDGTKCIVDAMKRKSNAKRISVVTSIGAGDSKRQAPWRFKWLMNTVMIKTFRDKNNQENIFLAPDGIGHNLEYCLVRPGQLGKGAPSGIVNVIDGVAGSIQRADVAAFMLGAVTDPDFQYVRKTPCISSVSGTGWEKVKKEGFDDATKA